jgi:lysozyme
MSPEDIAEALRLVEQLLHRWEGMVLTPYLCSASVPTIGLGSTRYLDGRSVQLSDPPITREHALILARYQLRGRYLRAVRAYCPNLVEPAKVAALTSWTYNLGPGALRASTLRRCINAGDEEAIPAEWRRWNRAGGRVVRGLTARREAELRVGGWCGR